MSEHHDHTHVPDLNPALTATEHCPKCGATGLEKDHPRSLKCPTCGYQQYYNAKPVAGVIPLDAAGRVILLRRGFNPGKGLWTFPGGFMDLGESIEDAAVRETKEELQIDVTLDALVGVYSRANDRHVLTVYRGTATGEPQLTPEATEVSAFALDDIPWDELAFYSTTLALQEVTRQLRRSP